MYLRLLMAVTVLLSAAGCARLEPPAPERPSPENVLSAFFSEELLQCTADEDCTTGECDLSPVFTISTSGGYCLSFSSAFERWQRLELARSLARMASGDSGLHDAVLARVKEELQFVRAGPEEEAMVELLAALGTEESIGLLGELYRGLDGEVRSLAALALARSGDPTGIDEVVDVSFSPVVRLRIHAAVAVSGLCDKTSLGILRELSSDDHHMVRQAAAEALTRCGGPEVRSILDQAESRGTGDDFVIGAARTRVE